MAGTSNQDSPDNDQDLKIIEVIQSNPFRFGAPAVKTELHQGYGNPVHLDNGATAFIIDDQIEVCMSKSKQHAHKSTNLKTKAPTSSQLSANTKVLSSSSRTDEVLGFNNNVQRPEKINHVEDDVVLLSESRTTTSTKQATRRSRKPTSTIKRSLNNNVKGELLNRN